MGEKIDWAAEEAEARKAMEKNKKDIERGRSTKDEDEDYYR
jgi:hypothetical protein